MAPIVRTQAGAARQLASRARRRVRGRGGLRQTDQRRQSELVGAFLAAARECDLARLLARPRTSSRDGEGVPYRFNEATACVRKVSIAS
jgi:hypothetical protein